MTPAPSLPPPALDFRVGGQLVVAIWYLADDPPANRFVIYLTILASAASVLTGLFLRLVLCCVVGTDRDEGGRAQPDRGLELDSVANPVFDGKVVDGDEDSL